MRIAFGCWQMDRQVQQERNGDVGGRVCGAVVLLAGVSMSLSPAWDGEAASLLAPAHALPAQTHTHKVPQDK